MRGRTWNSWTQFHSIENPPRKKARPTSCSPRPLLHHEVVAVYARRVQRTTAEALASALDLSEVRMERVARIRAAIASNTYRVSSADLAQKLLQTMMGDFQ
jgi:flagellar biosynthesis anti-sigma factor FlgM